MYLLSICSALFHINLSEQVLRVTFKGQPSNSHGKWRHDKLELQNPVTRLKTYGDRCFEFAAAKEWNALPLRIKQSETLESFKSELKTFLFSKCYGIK